MQSPRRPAKVPLDGAMEGTNARRCVGSLCPSPCHRDTELRCYLQRQATEKEGVFEEETAEEVAGGPRALGEGLSRLTESFAATRRTSSGTDGEVRRDHGFFFHLDRGLVLVGRERVLNEV